MVKEKASCNQHCSGTWEAIRCFYVPSDHVYETRPKDRGRRSLTIESLCHYLPTLATANGVDVLSTDLEHISNLSQCSRLQLVHSTDDLNLFKG